MSNLYAIADLSGYASDMRDAAAKSIKDNYNENLDEYISLEQVYNIIADESIALDEENRYLLNEEINEKIFCTIKTWIYNCGLAKLASNDLIECAWDNDANEMVFWVKNTKNINSEDNYGSLKSNKNKRTKRKNTRD